MSETAWVCRLVWAQVLLTILQLLWRLVDQRDKCALLIDNFHGYCSFHSWLVNYHLRLLVRSLRLHERFESVVDNPAQFVLVESHEHAHDAVVDEYLISIPVWSLMSIHVDTCWSQRSIANLRTYLRKERCCLLSGVLLLVKVHEDHQKLSVIQRKKLIFLFTERRFLKHLPECLCKVSLSEAESLIVFS